MVLPFFCDIKESYYRNSIISLLIMIIGSSYLRMIKLLWTLDKRMASML